jgi:hypothetical protein
VKLLVYVEMFATRSINLHRRSGVISGLFIDCVHYVFDLAGIRMWLPFRGAGTRTVRLSFEIARNDLPIVEILCPDILVVFNLPPFGMCHSNFLALVEKYGTYLLFQSYLSTTYLVRLTPQ